MYQRANTNNDGDSQLDRIYLARLSFALGRSEQTFTVPLARGTRWQDFYVSFTSLVYLLLRPVCSSRDLSGVDWARRPMGWLFELNPLDWASQSLEINKRKVGKSHTSWLLFDIVSCCVNHQDGNKKKKGGKGVVEFMVCLLTRTTLEHQRSTWWANRGACALISLAFSLPASLTSRRRRRRSIMNLHSRKMLIFVDLMAAERGSIRFNQAWQSPVHCSLCSPILLFYRSDGRDSEETDKHDVFCSLH